MKKLLNCLVLAGLLLTSLSAAAVVIQTEDSAGVYPIAAIGVFVVFTLPEILTVPLFTIV